jgi:hypothetical protein
VDTFLDYANNLNSLHMSNATAILLNNALHDSLHYHDLNDVRD